jgi:hypothetical protein
MERAGLAIVSDGNGDLNPDVVQIQSVQGNVDPIRYVLSTNILRRHLTSEQKRELIAKVLKAKPELPDNAIGKLAKADSKTVRKVRSKLQANSEIPNKTERTEASGRKARGRKPKPTSSDEEFNNILANAVTRVLAPALKSPPKLKAEQRVFNSPEEAHAAKQPEQSPPGSAEVNKLTAQAVQLTQKFTEDVNAWLESNPKVSAEGAAALANALLVCSEEFERLAGQIQKLKKGESP